ncbi:Fic family protein [Maridesulfovibrio sp.]|uniref:Fic family protein n=1 Tax=Maridesulfovibrio sp. TaxID=2795000 RepID=UPI0029CA6087|nr:Fic family protein [Maridesulfovibrio sp.]
MTKYIWQSKNWPELKYEAQKLLPHLSSCRRKQGELLSRIATLDENFIIDAEAALLESEAIRTSEIEGLQLDPQSVRSSVARKLGLEDAGIAKVGRYEDNLVTVLLDAVQGYSRNLNKERLFAWHAALFPSGYSGITPISAGTWRSDKEGAMHVISGRPGKQRIHYEAPPAEKLGDEMNKFIDWFNTPEDQDGIIRAGIAHFRFVTIHPFDDGNGRLARIITDLAMAQDEKTARRAYSISAQIAGNRKDYYDILEHTQKGNGDITLWLVWFIDILEKAILNSQSIIAHTLMKADFWRKHATIQLNERQRKVLNKLLDAGPDGFTGGLSNKNYVSIAKCGPATATRDLKYLVDVGMLMRSDSGGRSTRYGLIW